MNHKKLTYTRDRETGWYKLATAPPTASTLPNELKVEERKSNHIQAQIIIHGRERLPKEVDPKKGWKWFTGLRETNHVNVYSGNFITFGRYRNPVQNYCLFQFSPDSETLTLLFFDGLKRRFGGIDDLIRFLR